MSRHLSLPLLMMVLLKRLDDYYKNPSDFLVKVKLLHGNRIDCSSSVLFLLGGDAWGYSHRRH